jgi:hypothetical protein
MEECYLECMKIHVGKKAIISKKRNNNVEG